MSMEGEVVATTPRSVVHARAPAPGARMSFSLVAMTSRSIGRPMRLGGIAREDVAEVAGRHREADTERCGAPSAAAAAK